MEYVKLNKYIVSVIIPVYNVRDYLEKCLQSVIQQTYHYLDIIIIDDGSTDGSNKICDKFAKKDKRIRVIHTVNHGLSHARNIGLDIRNGEFVYFVDSDDWIESNTIELLLHVALITKTSVVAAKSFIEYEGVSQSFEGDYGILVFQGEEVLHEFVIGTFGDEAWNKLFHYSCFDNLRFPDGRNYEDTSTTWKLVKRIADSNLRVAIIQKALYHYRMRNGSISRTPTLKNIIDCWKAYHEKYEALNNYKNYLLYSCLQAAGRMWIYYWGFSKAEKIKAEIVIKEMHGFAWNHIKSVIGRNFGLKEKLICVMLLNKTNIWFLILYITNLLRVMLSSSKKKAAYK